MRALAKMIAITTLMILAASGTSCNTLRGMGKDVQRAGEKIQEWAR